MDSLDIGKGIRKSWGGVKPVERVHRDERVRKSEKDHRRELRQGTEGLEDVEDVEDVEDDDTGFPVSLRGSRRQSEMMALKRDKGESVIPLGCYCYDVNGNCPYHMIMEGKPAQGDGFCWFLGHGDWMDDGHGMTNLWDSCKICSVNEPKLSRMVALVP